MIGSIPNSAPLIEPISWFFIACVAGGVAALAVIAFFAVRAAVNATGRLPTRSERPPHMRNWR